MKKLFAKIISLTLAVVMSLFALNGCGLVTTNEERDMAQIIATVALDEDLSTDIKKSKLVTQFVNNASYYVNGQGYTVKETYELLLEDIVEREILAQQARLALTGATQEVGNEKGYFTQAQEVAEANRTTKEKVLTTKNHLGQEMTTVTKSDSLDKFLTEYEYNSAVFGVIYAINNYIESYMDEEDEEEHEHESYAGTARATLSAPTEQEGNEYELKNDEKLSKIDKESSFYKSLKFIVEENDLDVDIDSYTDKYSVSMAVYKEYIESFKVEGREDKRAVSKIIKDLRELGLITSEEAAGKTPTTANEFLELSYFKASLNDQFSNLVISKYELALTNQQEKIMDNNEELYNVYLNVYESQEAIYKNDYTAYESALENATEVSQILYNPDFGGKYGQILNLLIGFNEAQNEVITNSKADKNLSDEELLNIRNSVLATLTAQDLRSSWVDAGYGEYNASTGKVTFKNQYCKTSSLSSFIGTVYGATDYTEKDEYNNEVTKHYFEAVKPTVMTFNEFLNGKTGVFDGVNQIMGFTGNSGVLTSVAEQNSLGYVLNEETLDKYQDLIYAFSTDGGSLSEGFGYLYSPKTSKTKYVQEYAEAAQRLINLGVGAYEVVATEYGYHIMLCARVIEPSTQPIVKIDFVSMLSVEDSIPYNFKEYQKSRVVYDNINKITTAFINRNLDSSVTYFENTYKDLLEE
ncbi:MAG: hypothetical protein IKL82_01050 [Clostridia bacterium]|nr:hypothetical protein [Clostridia bacterium]